MERWLIDKYGLSVDLSICIVFHFWKKEYIYGFQGQDKDFWSYKQATIWQKWSKKINPATLKKKKDDFWTTILALCKFRNRKTFQQGRWYQSRGHA